MAHSHSRETRQQRDAGPSQTPGSFRFKRFLRERPYAVAPFPKLYWHPLPGTYFDSRSERCDAVSVCAVSVHLQKNRAAVKFTSGAVGIGIGGLIEGGLPLEGACVPVLRLFSMGYVLPLLNPAPPRLIR